MLTTECNLQCKYCFDEAVEDFDESFSDSNTDYSLPKRVNYDLGVLSSFCSLDPECVLTFYGGEPLLCIQAIKETMDRVKNAKHYMIQTNGLFLDRLEANYLNRFHTILVSIDGEETLTDYYRGKGTFRKVINNLKLIRQNGFEGELIARMTVMEQTKIYKQVKWLLNNEEYAFSSVHWQLNAGFWGNDFPRRNFRNWTEKNYKPGIQKLSRFWVNFMEKEKKVLRLYPFLGIANSLLAEEKTGLMRCGGGWINYTIQTDGFIVPCPTMWGMKDYYLGHISDTNPLKLRQVLVDAPCTECDILEICGGRCLYTNITKRWKKNQHSLICNTVRNLVDVIETELPRIKRLVKDQRIQLSDFEYMKYNGCEIIP